MKERSLQDRLWAFRWPAIIVAVVLGLAVIQVLRVNPPKEKQQPSGPPPVDYTEAGPLLNGYIDVPAQDFFSKKIDLNRTAGLTGSFRTSQQRATVEVLVMTDQEFSKWSAGEDHKALARTNYVPGGKINAGLSPGSYFLVIDNRKNDQARSVFTDISLD
jgi:hypothetical protein